MLERCLAARLLSMSRMRAADLDDMRPLFLRLPTLSGDPGEPGDGDGTPPSQRELSFVLEGV